MHDFDHRHRNTCGSDFEYRYNPSNTGNIRINSRFTLADNLILTVDPSYQYVKANGGGTAVLDEGTFAIGSARYTGYVGSTPYAGYDVNGDGGIGTVRVLAPSQTQTHRFGVISSLRYDINEDNTVRVAYSFDHARHRQTGETNLIDSAGNAIDVFPVNEPIVGSQGNVLQKRDRLSYAILHQISGEYRGTFGPLTVNAGVRAPFFKRDLDQNCFTTSASGNLACFAGNVAADAAYAAANPTLSGPQKRVFKYDKILPSAGFVFDVSNAVGIFGNYSKGLQVPGTDNLYQSFFYARDNINANPTPETTDNFDLGVRYRTSTLQAQLSGWYTIYQNRLAQAYDRDLNVTIYRNLGRVDKYGIDGSITYRPVPELLFYAFGSYLKSEIKDDVAISATTIAATAGKRESAARSTR